MLSVMELARHFKTSRTTIYRWVDNGIPHRYEKTGKKMAIQFDLEEATKWIEEQRKIHAIRVK